MIRCGKIPPVFFNNNDKNWRLFCNNLYQIDKVTLDDITNSVYSGSDAIIENEPRSLHPTHRIFAEIAKVYSAIINNRVPKNQHVFRVKDFFEENNSDS